MAGTPKSITITIHFKDDVTDAQIRSRVPQVLGRMFSRWPQFFDVARAEYDTGEVIPI